MNERRAAQIFVRLFFTFAVPFWLAASSARLLLSEQFLHFEYLRPGFPNDFYGFTIKDRLEYGPYAIDYLFNSESIDYLAELRLPGGKCWNQTPGAADCDLFSDRELRHMEDVKNISAIVFALAILCAVIALGTAFASGRRARFRPDILLGLRRGSKLTLLSIMALTILAVMAWDRAFDVFHEMFFAEGSWRFPFSDSLIRLYPEQLFFDAALVTAILSSLCAVLILFLLSLWDKRSH